MNRREALLGVLLAPLVKPLAKLLPAKSPVTELFVGGMDHIAFDPARAQMVTGIISKATNIPVHILLGQPRPLHWDCPCHPITPKAQIEEEL